jgi:sugar lactone lactonase YvrE
MKFRGESQKNSIVWTLILAIATILVSGREISAQAQPSPTNPEPTPETEEIFPASPWRRAHKIRTLKGHITGIDSLVFTTDGKTLISGGSDNEGLLRFWSVSSGEKLEEFRGQQTDVLTLAVTPDGQTLVSSGTDAIINLWSLIPPEGEDEVSFKKEYRTSFLEHSNSVLAVAISPDGNILVSGGLDGLRVWTLNPRRPLYKLAGIGNPVYALSFNPNGYIMASGNGDGRVQFWNVREGTFISEFFPHQEAITGVAFTPDGKSLITASNDRSIKIWDLESGQLIHTLSGHTDKIRAIALNPDGRTLATGSNDGIRIWDLESGEEIRRLSGHKDWVTSLAFSPDGRLLASGGLDSVIVLWESTSLKKPEKLE